MNEAEGHTSQPAQTGGTAPAAPVAPASAPAVQPAPAAPAGQPQNLFQVGGQFLLQLFFIYQGTAACTATAATTTTTSCQTWRSSSWG